MKEIIGKISRALQVVLLAPIKLPEKVMNIIKYIALGFEVVETVFKDNEKKKRSGHGPTRYSIIKWIY